MLYDVVSEIKQLITKKLVYAALCVIGMLSLQYSSVAKKRLNNK